ncbi:hypothetical protein ACFSUJ_32875 [Streptomyces lusitanus]|uniref:Uncharacterized protein n=1 Tax=Streptomyces lusitanus TaxID=68232 RepID=A0ABU3JU42_9ACTN|nr:hypothetical protein [Streptomyces lusitanus]
MDVVTLLKSACLLVEEETATEHDITVNDVWEYLAHDEWDTALGLLEELGDAQPLPAAFWASLAAAARELGFERSAAWCHWREGETRNGIIRADLTLRSPSDDAGRRSPLPGAGVLRPMWNIGTRTEAGEPDLRIARIWVEDAPALEPGGSATVRLAPLTPESWRHLEPGHVITLHETRAVAGTAVVLQADFRHTEMCWGES